MDKRLEIQKHKYFFSKNVSSIRAKELASELGFSLTSNLGKYLGMLLLHSRVTKGTYSEILEKVKRRLSGWNATSLLLAGRVTLSLNRLL